LSSRVRPLLLHSACCD